MTAILMFAVFAIVIAFERGWLHPTYIPIPQLNLAAPNRLLLDWQIARLANDPAQCSAVLRPPYVVAARITDQPIANGCGWMGAVKLSSVGKARLTADQLSCPAAAAVTLWMTHIVQPAAHEILGKSVTAVHHLGTYACRNINGNAKWRDARSQHATANALDISGFTLSDGRTISVFKHWSGNDEIARFLQRIHLGACQYFRVALGPGYNASHRDHFHYDRGAYRTCR